MPGACHTGMQSGGCAACNPHAADLALPNSPHAPPSPTHPLTPLLLPLQVGKFARVGTMMAKDSVRTRMESEQGISFTEFTYQLLQVGRGGRGCTWPL